MSDNTDPHAGQTGPRTKRKSRPQARRLPATHPELQEPLRCAGCGACGSPPTIVWDKTQAAPGPVLTPIWAWNERYVLLCTDCKRAWQLNRAARKGPRT
jgi:hypothetical protein